MRTYWDTSAAINAALSPEVFRRLDSGEHVARLHLLAEFFATMTGRGVEITDQAGNADRMVFTQNQCAAWLRKFADRLQFEELTKDEALNGLDKAQRLGVQGARVYDYWHALVSDKAKSNQLLTRNTRHFQGLTENVAWP
jgi:site-specific recombinase XerD